MTLRNGVLRVHAALLALALAASPAIATGTVENRGEIGIQVGARLADPNIAPDGEGVAPTFGIAGAWRLSRKWAFFADASTSTHDSFAICDEGAGCWWLTPEMDILTIRTGMERRFKAGPGKNNWYASFAPAWTDIQFNGIQIHRYTVSLGGGRRWVYKLGSLRLDARIDVTGGDETDADLSGGEWERIRVKHVVVTAGWSFGFSPRRDADADGVRDKKDYCADTPEGTAVDSGGCPRDDGMAATQRIGASDTGSLYSE